MGPWVPYTHDSNNPQSNPLNQYPVIQQQRTYSEADMSTQPPAGGIDEQPNTGGNLSDVGSPNQQAIPHPSHSGPMASSPDDIVLQYLWENINSLVPPQDAVSDIVYCFLIYQPIPFP